MAEIARENSQEKDQSARLILLGTMGGARMFKGRCPPAQVVVVNKKLYVVDCGLGVARQLTLANCDLAELRAVFITHHHDDHNLDFGNLLQAARMSGLIKKVRTFGPYPLKQMMNAYLQMNDYGFHTYQEQLGMIPLNELVEVNEIFRNGIVMQDENVTVSCVSVAHPPIPAFGFRIEARGASITISGDTTYCPELVRFAEGSDILVHEAMYKPAIDKLVERAPQYAGLGKFLVSAHSSAEDAGKVAQEARVKTLSLTHFVPGDDPAITDEMWAQSAGRFFKGRIIVGKDLMAI